MQPVKIICTLDPFKPKKKGKGKPKKGNGVVTKKGEQVWGKIESAWDLNLFLISNCWDGYSLDPLWVS